MKNRLDLGKFMNKADWIIQPSICEGDSYTLKEALYRGIPVVVCELGYFKEIGIKDGENALFLNEDCSNVKDVVHRMKKPLNHTMWLSTENHAGLNNTNLNFSDFTISFQGVPE